MLFFGVVMAAQCFEQRVGLLEGRDFFSGKKCGKLVLPKMMGAFDFTFGLERGGITQGDFIELQGAAQLGERFGRTQGASPLPRLNIY